MAIVFQVVDYEEQWPIDFERERSRLADVFRDVAVEIAHIGSTSVPGLCAKPIIDICVGVFALSVVEERIGSMEGLGYEYVPKYEAEIPDRRYFRRPLAPPRTHHIHACRLNGAIWNRHLAFRDWLRTHPLDRDAYGALKQELYTRHMQDRPAYTEAKGPFIQAILERTGH